MKRVKSYILPFIVLTILIQVNAWVDKYLIISSNEPVKNVKNKKEIKIVKLTKMGIAYKKKDGKSYQLLHFAYPETTLDFQDLGKFSFEVFPKGSEFELIEDGKNATGNIVFRKNGILYYNNEIRKEYSLFKPTDEKIYQGTMHGYMVTEFDRFSADLENKLLSKKYPLKIKICKPASDVKVGRRLADYGDSEKLYRELMDNYFVHAENFIKKINLERKINIIDKVLIPVIGNESYMFCSLVEFMDLESYVAFQNFPH